MRAHGGIDFHGPEFEDLETTTLISDAFLAKKDRAGRNDLRHNGHHQRADGQNGERD